MKERVIKYWQSTLAGVLIFVGFWFFKKGRIDFTEFTTYIALIPSIILLLTKNFKSEKDS